MIRTLVCCIVLMAIPQSSFAADDAGGNDVEAEFRQFLDEFRPQMKARNAAYLQAVHPKLPAEAYDLFFDVTLNMMQHAEKNEGIEPTVECQDFNVCKVVYPQPNDSWAAQRFILHQGTWHWLDQ